MEEWLGFFIAMGMVFGVFVLTVFLIWLYDLMMGRIDKYRVVCMCKNCGHVKDVWIPDGISVSMYLIDKCCPYCGISAGREIK